MHPTVLGLGLGLGTCIGYNRVIPDQYTFWYGTQWMKYHSTSVSYYFAYITDSCRVSAKKLKVPIQCTQNKMSKIWPADFKQSICTDSVFCVWHCQVPSEIKCCILSLSNQARNARMIPTTVPTLPAAHSCQLGLWYWWKWSNKPGCKEKMKVRKLN